MVLGSQLGPGRGLPYVFWGHSRGNWFEARGWLDLLVYRVCLCGVGWAGVSQKDIYFFKRRLEAHPISQGGYKILGESNREKGLATGVAGEGRPLGQ